MAKWISKYGLPLGTPTPCFISELQAEMARVRELVWKQYPDMAQQIPTKKENPKVSFLAYLLQHRTHRNFMAVAHFMRHNLPPGYSVAVYVFDGLMIHVRNASLLQPTWLPQLLRACENYVEDVTGSRIQLEVKPMTEALDLTAVEPKEEIHTTNPLRSLEPQFKNLVSVQQGEGQYVGRDLAHLIPEELPQFLFIQSPTGTGKTTFMKHQFQKLIERYRERETENGESFFVALSPRVSVTLQHLKGFTDLGFRHYLYDAAEETDDGPKVRCIITTLDSLIKYPQDIDVLYIDEVESLLEHVYASSLKNRQAVWMRLLQACSRAKHVICTDADFGNLSITFFTRLLQDLHKKDGIAAAERALLLQNTLQPTRQTYKFAYSRKQWYAELQANLKSSSSKVFIGCDSKRSARLLYEKTLAWSQKNIEDFQESSVLLYTSDDGDRSDLENVNTSWAGKKVIICSPCIIYGIDYSNAEDPFTAVMGFYTENGWTMTAEKVRQQIRRIRRIHRDKERQQSYDVCMTVHLLLDTHRVDHQRQT